jgi:predicted phage terminase large subunit-like protein
MPSKISTDRFLAAMCRESYWNFFTHFWSTVVAEKFTPSWHIRKLCDELQTLSERVFLDQPKEYDLIYNCPPGMTKPVWEGMSVMMGNGTWKKLRDVNPNDEVIGKSGRPCKVTSVHFQGNLPCIRIITAGGRKIIAAPDHPILTADGWVNAGKIIPGHMLALMHRSDPWHKQTTHSIHEYSLAGYLIGDGSLTQNSCSLTNADPDYLEHFCNCVDHLGFAYSVRKTKSSSSDCVITRISLKRKKGECTGPRDWVRSVGLAEKNSYTKFVPRFIYEGSDEQVAEFLASYFHCDGHVSYKDSGKRNIQIAMTTVSKRLAVGLHRLFLRLGISMRLREHVNKNGFKYNRELAGYVTYRVETTDQDAAVRFLEKIPLRGRKKRKLEDFKPQRKTFEQKYWPDKVVSVETIGKLPCRCLTVEDDASFCVEGVVVHNSTVVSVLWQPWVWTRMPSARFITGSHSERLALDLSRKSRDCVTSDKYQSLFPEIQLRTDMNTKGMWMNQQGGMRYAVGVGGSVIGMHAHFIAVDDPIDPQGALSDLILAEANGWMTETLSRRKINVMLTPTVLIMQRLHQNDPSGNALERGTRIRHCCVPCDTSWEIKPPEWKDNYQNGLLDPTRLPVEACEQAREELGDVPYAGQYGQSPVPRGGALFQVDRLNYCQPNMIPTIWKRPPLRYWDKATTAKSGAWSVGTKGGLDLQDRVWILDVIRQQWDSGTREERILQTAKLDGKKLKTWVEQEPAGSGKESAENTVKRLTLSGLRAGADKATGDKELRADPFSAHVNMGNVILVQADWNKVFVEELRFFPRSRYKDQVDSASGMFNKLCGARLRIGAFR